MALAREAIAELVEADFLGGCEQVKIAVLGAVERIDGMIGDIELHDAPAEPVEPIAPGANGDAFGDRRRAGGRRAGAAVDLDQAQPAGAERLQHVGGAELRDLGAGFHRRAHDRGARRHRDRLAVNRQRDGLGRARSGRAVICLVDERHLRVPLIQPPEDAAARRNLQGNG